MRSPARTATGTCSASATRREWRPTPSSKLLFDKYGKKWYFITPDYAFGHTLQQGFEANLKKFGGTVVGRVVGPARNHGFLLLL